MSGPLPDGVYFNLSFNDYLAVRRFSSHGVIQMTRSCYDFWARSWMNPNPPDEESEFKDKGTAYHARIVEGRKVFEAQYAVELEPDDYPEAMRTTDDLKEFLRGRGLKLTGNKPELIARVLEADPDAQVWDDLVARHAATHAGKTMISHKWLLEIEIAAANIEKNPELQHAFRGGAAEVSVLWTATVETPDGDVIEVPMKSRFDYVKPKAWVDLKSFSNSVGMRLSRAVSREYANRRYYVSTAVYYQAADAAKELVAAGKFSGASKETAEALFTHDKLALYVWQQTVVPVALGRVYPRELQVVQIGDSQFRDALAEYARCWQTFGDDPWIPQSKIETADDTEFPAYIGE